MNRYLEDAYRIRGNKQNAKRAPMLVECVVGQDADPVRDLSKWKI